MHNSLVNPTELIDFIETADELRRKSKRRFLKSFHRSSVRDGLGILFLDFATIVCAFLCAQALR